MTRATVSIVAFAWILLLASRPVHIPVFEISREFAPHRTQVLSGVKGQTFVTPTDALSRIDVWLHTNVSPGEFVRIKFELQESVDRQTTLASGIAVIDQSGSDWQARLLFDPALTSRESELYLRLEAILSNPTTHLHFDYYRVDLYPHGDLLDLDRIEVPGQDLRFKLYRSPTFPKPLAWVEAAMAPALDAAVKATGPPNWVISLLMWLGAFLTVGIFVAISTIAGRMLNNNNRVETSITLLLLLTGIALAIVAGPEAPVGKLVVQLT